MCFLKEEKFVYLSEINKVILRICDDDDEANHFWCDAGGSLPPWQPTVTSADHWRLQDKTYMYALCCAR